MGVLGVEDTQPVGPFLVEQGKVGEQGRFVVAAKDAWRVRPKHSVWAVHSGRLGVYVPTLDVAQGFEPSVSRTHGRCRTVGFGAVEAAARVPHPEPLAVAQESGKALGQINRQASGAPQEPEP